MHQIPFLRPLSLCCWAILCSLQRVYFAIIQHFFLLHEFWDHILCYISHADVLSLILSAQCLPFCMFFCHFFLNYVIQLLAISPVISAFIIFMRFITFLLILPRDKWSNHNLTLRHQFILTHALSFFLYERRNPYLAFPLSFASRTIFHAVTVQVEV